MTDQRPMRRIFLINRATAEFVGAVLYVIGLVGLTTLSGGLPLFDLGRSLLTILVLDSIFLIAVGGFTFAAAMRRGGLSWPGTLGVVFTIAAIVVIAIYIPLWFLTTQNPFAF